MKAQISAKIAKSAAFLALACTLIASAAIAAPKKIPAQDAAGAACEFGNNYGPLSENKHPYFRSKKLGATLKIDPSDSKSRVLLVQVVELKHKKTKQIYHLNYTFEDSWDGGNTIGWIEQMVHEQVDKIPVVAVIGDSDIYCSK